jgi:hypothetical protein
VERGKSFVSLRVEVDSLQYVKVPVAATVSGVAHDPTADTVKMAFTDPFTDPVSGDWKTATWETFGTTYYAKCLVGPGGTIQLAAGTYKVWVKVTDSPEIPILPAGRVTIY